MTLNSTIARVTDRIRNRSQVQRGEYLKRMGDAAASGEEAGGTRPNRGYSAIGRSTSSRMTLREAQKAGV